MLCRGQVRYIIRRFLLFTGAVANAVMECNTVWSGLVCHERM